MAITVEPPEWFKGRHYHDLSPTKEMLLAVKRAEISKEEYSARYLDLLQKRNLDPATIVRDLGADAVLLCYESGGQFCHRHLAAQWLRDHGIPTMELGQETEAKMKPLFGRR